MNNKVCIVMPAFNAAKTIEKSIKSVLSQTYGNWNLFIVNDGSIDYTQQIIDQFSNKKIISIFQKNAGVSAARNTALRTAKRGDFDYIAYLDSDDFWEESHLAESMSYLKNYDFVYSDVNLINEQNYPMCRIGIQTVTEFNKEKLKIGNFIYTSSVVHKFKCYNEIGDFDSSLDSLEDYDYWIRVARKGFTIIQKSSKTCTYLVRESSLSMRGGEVKSILDSKHAEFFNSAT